MRKPFPDDVIESAIDARDTAGILRMLGAGLDPNWTGAAGNTLLHAAARMGDAALVDALLDRGARAFVHNAAAQTPRDAAIAWGHDALAARLEKPQQDEMLTRGHATIPFASLQEIRDRSLETGVSQFHYLAQRGEFAQVITLAANDAEGLSAADLLAKGLDGDTALMKICQHGQLGALMKPELWMNRPAEFGAIWQEVPQHYRNEVNYDSFMSQLRQAKLQSYGKTNPKGFKLK